MKPGNAVLLRLLGPLIELPCAIGVVRYWGKGVTWLGKPAEHYFMAGMFIGLCLVIAGLTLSKRPQPARRRPGRSNL
jgi:hypothetical protein